MKKYTVIALSVGGNGTKIFHSGDTVREIDFAEGEADQKVKDGFLKLKEEEGKSEADLAAEAAENAKAEAQKLLDDEAAAKALSERAIAVGLPEDSTLEEIEAEEMATGKAKTGSKKK